MLPHQLELLKKNPLLVGNDHAFNQAVKIFDQLANCASLESYFNDPRKNYLTYKAVIAPRAGGTHQRYLDLLDLPILNKIELGFLGGPFYTVEQLLTNETLLTSFLAFWPKFDAVVPAEPAVPVAVPSEPAEPVPEPPKTVLQYCQLVKFSVHSSLDFREWIEDRTFNGILFKWKEIGNGYLFDTTWHNSRGSFVCPKHILDNYINALQMASAEYHFGGGFDKLAPMNNGELFTFQPLIKVIDEKPGFFDKAGRELWYADQVPWDRLVEIDVQIKK